MSNSEAWSSKNFDQRALDAARQAAREKGLSLSDFLRKLERAEDSGEEAEERPRDTAADALDSLAKRLENVEARSTLAIAGIDQSLAGLLSRIERTDRDRREDASTVESLIEDLRSTHDALREKVDQLETEGRDQQSLGALKSLEDALGQLADHVNRENALAQEEADAIKARVEAGLSEVAGQVEGVEIKVQSSLSDAARRMDDVIEKARASGEEAARKVSDRLSLTQADLNQTRTELDAVSKRVGGVETDMSGAIKNMEGTLLRMQDRLQRAETATDQAMTALEATFDNLDKRINAVAKRSSPEAAEALKRQFEERFEGLARDLRQSITAARSQMAAEIENAARAANPELVAKLETSIDEMGRRIARSDSRNARALEAVGGHVQRIAQSFDRRLRGVEDREDGDAVREEVGKLAQSVAKRLDKIENRETRVIERVGAEMSKLADHLDARVTESEKRSAAAIEQVGEQVAGVANRLHQRQEAALKAIDEKIEGESKRVDSRLSDALSNVSDRLQAMQEQSSASMSPVQKAIASLAERIESLEDQTGLAGSGHPPGVTADEPEDEEDFEAGLEGWIDTVDPTDAVEAGEAVQGGLDEDMFEPEPDAAAPEASEENPLEAFAAETDENLGDTEVADGDAPADDDASAAPDDQARAAAGDYLARARQAALDAAAEASRSSTRFASVAASKQAAPKRRAGPNVPLIAAASAVAIVAAGAANYEHLRGRKPAEPVILGATADLKPVAQSSEADGASDDVEPETALDADLAADDLFETEPAGDETPEAAPPPAEAEPTSAARRAASAPFPAIPTALSIEDAARRGDPIAQYELGLKALAAEDYARAADMIRSAALIGLPLAQYRYGKLHEQGLGVARDLIEARMWAAKAASAGVTAAMHDLAVFFAQGEGGPQSYASAAEWFRRAAEFGVADSQFNLGVLYEQGLGVSADPAEALFWFEIASTSGDAGARQKIADLRRGLPQEVADQARQRAASWRPSSPDAEVNGAFPQPLWGAGAADQVRGVQTALAALGYAPGVADGVMGAQTREAISAFEADEGLEPSGRLSPRLIEALNSYASAPAEAMN